MRALLPMAASFTAQRGMAATTSFISRATDDPGRARTGIEECRTAFRSLKMESWRFGSNTVDFRRLCAHRHAGAGSAERRNAARSRSTTCRTPTGPPTARRWPLFATLPRTAHWRLEYPIGKVLFDSINWISHPKISPDGKWIAFADHENPGGDDEGSVAVIAADGTARQRKNSLPAGFPLQGIVWSPAGDEIWFTSSRTGSATNPRAVTLSGKLRTITNVPGGMWLEDHAQTAACSWLRTADAHRHSRRGAGRKRGTRTGLVRLVGSCATSLRTDTRLFSKKKATAADQITPSFCATPMVRLRHALAKGCHGHLARWQMGRHQAGKRRSADFGSHRRGRVATAYPRLRNLRHCSLDA